MGCNSSGRTDDDAKEESPTCFANVELCERVVVRTRRLEDLAWSYLFPYEKRKHAKLSDAKCGRKEKETQ
jgi:hypothetical protein